MLPIALIYGAISGLITISIISISMQLSPPNEGTATEWFGYLIMLLALTLVFFAVKRHRDLNLGGVIRFLPAFLAGLGVAAIAGLVYTLGWELYLAVTGADFITEYAASLIAEKQAAGLPEAQLQAEISAIEQAMAQYSNPVFRMPITFLEIFPVGLLVALISASLLRNPEFLPARG